MKFFFISVILGAFLAPSYALEINNQKFIADYQENVKYILQNYPVKKESPLEAQIFDINNNSFLGFLTSSKGYKKPDGDILAMMYYDQFKVNNKDTSFCFILYDSKSQLLKNYLTNTSFSYADTTIYLSLHEMGHCLYSHQFQIGLIKEKLNARENEQLADMFIITYFSILGQKENALKIIEQSRKLKTTDIHANAEKLQQFYVLFSKIENQKQYDDFGKIFKISFDLFLNLR